MAKSININDIAKRAGVSRSTVSRVLTNNRNVKKETLAKIRQAMEEMHYRPNVLARGLATGRLNLIAMLLSEPENPFYPRLIAHMDTEFRRRGYVLSICYLGLGEEERGKNLAFIQEYGFSGFIIGDIKSEPAFVEEVRKISRPLVFFNRHLENRFDFDSVVVDNYLGGYLAGKHLTGLGHRDIGMLTGPLIASASRECYRGFRDALAESGLVLGIDMIGEGDLTLEGGATFAEELFRKKKGRACTALFAGNDYMALGILHYCREKGIRVPQDINIVGFDDLPFSGTPLFNLTTIRQPYADMSVLTAERLVARMEGDRSECQMLLLEPELVIRKTTGPA